MNFSANRMSLKRGTYRLKAHQKPTVFHDVSIMSFDVSWEPRKYLNPCDISKWSLNFQIKRSPSFKGISVFDAMDDADADAALEKFFEEEPFGLEILITSKVFLSRWSFFYQMAVNPNHNTHKTTQYHQMFEIDLFPC